MSNTINPFKDYTNYMSGGSLNLLGLAGSSLYYAPDCSNVVEPVPNGFGIFLSDNAKSFLFGSDKLEKEFNQLFNFDYYDLQESLILYGYFVDENGKVYITSQTKTEYSGEHNFNDIDNIGTSTFATTGVVDTTMSPSEQVGAMVGGMLGYGIVGSIVGIIGVDFATGKAINNGAIAGAIINDVKSVFAGEISQSISSAFGITSIAGSMAIGLVVGSILSEAVEIALGQDNHFGFGGSLLGYNDLGEPQYADQQSRRGFVQNIKDVFATTQYDMTGTLSDYGDNFMDSQYSDEAINSAEQQSANSSIADNPDNEPTDISDGIDDGYGSYDSDGNDSSGETTNSDSDTTGEGLGFL